MKFIILFFSIVLINNSCNHSKFDQNNLEIMYSASSRGVYQQIKINKKTILEINKRGGDSIIRDCSTSDWEQLIKLLIPIQIDKIPEFKPPSKNHQFDGALIARLTISSHGKIFESQSFDHGNPPKEISILVKEILSIAQNIE